MSPNGVATAVHTQRPKVGEPPRTRSRFHVWLVLWMLAIVIGFWPTYFAPTLRGTTLAHDGTVTLASERKAITLAADVLQRYAGQYAMGGTSVTVIVNGAQLALQPPDGRTSPLLAESETSFFLE